MIKLEKIYVLTAENLYNLVTYLITKILSVLYNVHIIFREQNKFVFYIKNYINWDLFNQLYNSGSIEKSIKNIDVVARKLRPTLIKTTNQRLEIARKKKWKRQKMIKRQKIKAMVVKR